MGGWSTRRAGVIVASGLTLAALGLIEAGPAFADDPDVTPPSGTLVIGDGSGWTNGLAVTLHVSATDDVGVVSVQVYQDGTPAATVPYADTIQYTLDPDKGDYQYSIQVIWRDAADNASLSDTQFDTVDRQAPVIDRIGFPDDPDGGDALMPVSVPSGDGWPIADLRFSSNGTTWSPPIPWAGSVDWHFLDPALGGSS
jgi:hypothetical protein